MESIEQRVKKIVAEQLGVNEAEIKNESSFLDDLGADSLDMVELVMALEDEFETEIGGRLHHLAQQAVIITTLLRLAAPGSTACRTEPDRLPGRFVAGAIGGLKQPVLPGPPRTAFFIAGPPRDESPFPRGRQAGAACAAWGPF